jgi:hypothetical protein
MYDLNMTQKTNNKGVIEAALKLPRQWRALLAEKLLDSLDLDDEFEVSSEWLSEIRTRCREIDESEAELIPAEDVFNDADNEVG